MSENLTLARPYARAAFESARGVNALAAWSQHLAFSARVIVDPRLASLIGDPRLGNAELASLVIPPDAANDSGFPDFLNLLVENHRVTLLPDIAALFEQLKRESERVLKVTLRSALEVPQAQADAIKAALKKRFGREIELDQQLDPTAIGGAVIDAGDVVIDGTVRGRLARLQNALT